MCRLLQHALVLPPGAAWSLLQQLNPLQRLPSLLRRCRVLSLWPLQKVRLKLHMCLPPEQGLPPSTIVQGSCPCASLWFCFAAIQWPARQPAQKFVLRHAADVMVCYAHPPHQVLVLLSAGAVHAARRQPALHKELAPVHLPVHSIPPSPFSQPATTTAAQPPSTPSQPLQGQTCAGQHRLRAIFTRSRQAAAKVEARSSASILAPHHLAKPKSHALGQVHTGKLAACSLQPTPTARAPSSAQPATSLLAQAVQRQIASRMPTKSLAK